MIDPGGQTVTAHDHLPMAVEIPTLIVWGTRDRMIPAWHAAAASAAIAGSRVELFEGAGHFPHLDEPDRFADRAAHLHRRLTRRTGVTPFVIVRGIGTSRRAESPHDHGNAGPPYAR